MSGQSFSMAAPVVRAELLEIGGSVWRVWIEDHYGNSLTFTTPFRPPAIGTLYVVSAVNQT